MPTGQREVAGVVAGDTIFVCDVDSVIEKELYKFRFEAVERMLFEKILYLESKKRGIEPAQLMDLEVNLKTKQPTKEEIASFIRLNPSFELKENQVSIILEGFKKEERAKFFADSLSEFFDKMIFLTPPFDKEVEMEKLFGFEIHQVKNTENEVFMVLNFDCQVCIEKLEDFSKLASKFYEQASFKIVYFNHVFGAEGRGLLAANKQGKAWPIIRLMAANPDRIYDETFYFEAVENLTLDLTSFKIDFENHGLLKELLLTRDYLFENQIFTTPFYVINGKGYDAHIRKGQLYRLLELELINARKKKLSN
jgi:16S rRNA G966 N2-methylase RsmD